MSARRPSSNASSTPIDANANTNTHAHTHAAHTSSHAIMHGNGVDPLVLPSPSSNHSNAQLMSPQGATSSSVSSIELASPSAISSHPSLLTINITRAPPSSDPAPSNATLELPPVNSLLSSPSADSNDNDNDDNDNDNDSDDENEVNKQTFMRPLIFYKRTNALRKHIDENEGSQQKYAPLQIFYPDTTMALGFSPLQPLEKEREEKEEAEATAHLVVLSTPTAEQRNRQRVFRLLLLAILLPIDVILLSTFYGLGSIPSIEFATGDLSRFSFITTILLIVLGYLAILVKDTRILTLFVACFYIDALLNLLRAYSILQICHFILQLGICHLSSQFKWALQPTWFSPIR